LTDKQINMIVEFVRGVGGLIIGFDGYLGLGSSILILLSKLGIMIKAVASKTSEEGIISKDGIDL